MNRSIISKIVLIVCLSFSQTSAHAEEESIHTATRRLSDKRVSELAEEGKHYEALVQAHNQADSLDLSDELSAARSAWALGLSARSHEYFKAALSRDELKGDERKRTIITRAIIELQEGRFEEARSMAERATVDMKASDLRAQFWLLIGEALREQGAFSLSESYYKKALEEGSEETRLEAKYLLGECQLKLGRASDARYQFASIDTNSQYASYALRRLSEIDLQQKNYESVLTWTDEGKKLFPTQFSDAWTQYARVSALTELSRVSQAQEELASFRVRHSQINPWYSLAEARVERALIEQLVPRARLDEEKSEKTQEVTKVKK